MRKQLAVITLALMFLCGCGATTKTASTSTPGQPLDPQGNWLFTLTGSDGTTALQFAGDLFELTSPVVTSNEMPSGLLGYTCGALTAAGQASATNAINLTVTEAYLSNKPTFALTGTIAASQQSMSGTWTSQSACTATGVQVGTWTAQELAPVTDTWTGTASNSAAITATLTENTDQTSQLIGQVTGTVTLSGSCFTGPLTVPNGGHLGELLELTTSPDANGATLTVTGTVTPTATSITGTYTVAGGPCDGQTFTANLTHN